LVDGELHHKREEGEKREVRWLGSGKGSKGACHTQFWKVHQMRTMYVPGSELMYTKIT
jgi:hypothetical protein